MKGFACAFVFALVVVYVSANKEEFMKFKSECHTELGLPDDLTKGGKPDLENPKVKCLFACIMKKKGSLVDGKVDLDKTFAHLAQYKTDLDESVKSKIKDCIDTANQEEDECEVAATFGKCAMPLVHGKQE